MVQQFQKRGRKTNLSYQGGVEDKEDLEESQEPSKGEKEKGRELNSMAEEEETERRQEKKGQQQIWAQERRGKRMERRGGTNRTKKRITHTCQKESYYSW
jgi:hypothetical protein